MATKLFLNAWNHNANIIEIKIPDDEMLIVPDLPNPKIKSIYIEGAISEDAFNKISKHMDEVWISDGDFDIDPEIYCYEYNVLIIQAQEYIIKHKCIMIDDDCINNIMPRLKCRILHMYDCLDEFANNKTTQIKTVINNFNSNKYDNTMYAHTQLNAFRTKMYCVILCLTFANIITPPKPIIKSIIMQLIPNYAEFRNNKLCWIWD